MSTNQNEISLQIDHLFRQESGKLVAVLTKTFGVSNMEMAEDVVQEAMIEALNQWYYKGVRPLSWGIHNKINQGMFSGVAISGYDAVSFLIEAKATKGKEDISLEWNKAIWKFSSEENKDLFEGNPKKYAPQFGGYCGFASSKGFTAISDPTTFEIIDGKLYLFADSDMKVNWMKDPAGNMSKCEANWK